MRFGSTAKVLLKCKLKYYRISECGGQCSPWARVTIQGPVGPGLPESCSRAECCPSQKIKLQWIGAGQSVSVMLQGPRNPRGPRAGGGGGGGGDGRLCDLLSSASSVRSHQQLQLVMFQKFQIVSDRICLHVIQGFMLNALVKSHQQLHFDSKLLLAYWQILGPIQLGQSLNASAPASLES